MTKLLSGTELVGYIQERQARQVRALRQASRIFPRLVIIKSVHASPVIDTYIRMKQRYAEEILIESAVETLAVADMPAAIERLNSDPLVHGIIVQLPLDDPSMTGSIVDMIAPEKDVDGLGKGAHYDSATATAINWLLSGYAIDLKNKVITIVGNGRLVGAPLAKIWQQSGYDVTGATIVDAGTASENGVIVGDVDSAVYERDDINITPVKGGVGPLTIAALCDHVIQSASKIAEAQK